MNLLLLAPEELSDGRATVTGRRARHMIDVLGVEPGTTLRAGVIGGSVGTASVTALGADNVDLDVELDGGVTVQPTVDLVLAVPRPKVLKRALQTAASLGVGRIDLVNAWRVEKSYFQSPAMEPTALREQVWLGCEQGGTTWLPEVHVHDLLMAFVERHLDGDDDRVRALLHPHASAGIEIAFAPGAQSRIVAAIGPEGGWIDRELETFEQREFRAVSLGRRVLRVEAAIAGLLSQIELLRRLLG